LALITKPEQLMRYFFLLALILSSSVLVAQNDSPLLIGHLHDEKIDIIEYSIDGSISEIYTDGDRNRIPEYYKDGLILIQSPGLSILNLKSNSFFEIGEKSELHFVGGFFKTKPWFFYSRMITENSMPETVIYDYKLNKIFKVIDGFYPDLSIKDDNLFFMQAEIDSTGNETKYFRDILRYDPKLDSIVFVTRHELSEYSKYDITEVKSISSNKYYYRVYDEHEYRYYLDYRGEEQAFYSGGHGHYIDGLNKEQYDLCFSSDGRYAAFTERNWNEITYIVLIDLKQGKRYELKAYGSFPMFHGDRLYYISDPDFYNTDDVSFRQIKDYALFYVNLSTREAKMAYDFEGGISFVK
jgi:hypothetical protein